MYSKIMSMFDHTEGMELHSLRQLLTTVYGRPENTIAEGLTIAYSRSGLNKQDTSRTLDALDTLSLQRVGDVVNKTLYSLHMKGPASIEFLTNILQRYRHNAVMAYMTISALAEQGRARSDIEQFFTLLLHYDAAELAPMWPYLSKTLTLPIDPAAIFNGNRTGLFDSIIGNYIFDAFTRKFGWSYEMLRCGIPPEYIYAPNGKNGILDHVSSRYTNGIARKVVTSLIGIAKIAQAFKVPVVLLTNSDHTGLIFDRLPSHYHYNDLRELEKEIEGVRIRFNSIARERPTGFTWTAHDIEHLVSIGSATVSWSTSAQPRELR